jgi:hypothetical protein
MDIDLRKSLDSKLGDISPINAKSMLNDVIAYELNTRNKTITADIKIKDYGNFRRFLKDTRLDSLVDYYPEDKIARNRLVQELDIYERNRILVFEAIYNFEKACETNVTLAKLIADEKNKKGYLSHNLLIDEFLRIFFPHKGSKVLLEIRNKLSHNQYPDKEIVKDILVEGTSFSNCITQHAISEYNSHTQLLLSNIS